MAHPPTVVVLIGIWLICATTVTKAQDGECCPSSYIPYYDYEIYKIDSLGQDVTMNCSHKVVPAPDDAVPVSWMLPDLRIIDSNSTAHNPKFNITDDEYQLTVINVGHDDIGLYHCMMEYQYDDDELDEVRWWLVKMGINTEGPYFEDLWEKYRMNTIIGLSSFFGFLLLCLGIWVVWHFRWIPEEGEEDYYLNTYTGTTPIDGVANQGFESSPSELKIVDTKLPAGYVPSPDVSPQPIDNTPPSFPIEADLPDVYTGSDHEMTSF